MSISIGFVSMLPIESLRQLKGVLMDGLNIFLCMFLGLVFSRSLYFAINFFAVDGGLFGGDFLCFYFGCTAYSSKFFDLLFDGCVIGGARGNVCIF